jgi:CheY-like chemotaxis protein
MIVMVSANGRELLAQRSAEEQALIDAFVVKPVTASMLAQAVEEVHAPQARLAPAAAERLRGLHLLVAEDNVTNQQVARELLEDEGARVQIAPHGQDAVDAVRAAVRPFDLVLMDLQMPVMDGLAATRELRRTHAADELPIVAMSANAMASDREACLAAGMNDHVGKPFDLDRLVRVILAQTGHSVTPPPPPSDTPLASALPAAWQDAAQAAGIDLAATLARLGGKAEVFARMLQSFLGDLAALPQRLHEAASGRATEPLSRTLHTFKGVAATLGVRPLAHAAAQAEGALSMGGDGGAAVAALAERAAALREPLAALAAALAAPDGAVPAAPASADLGTLHARVRELVDLLSNSDMAAMEAVAALRPLCDSTLDGWWQRVDGAVAVLDFDAARTHCEALLADATA